ncbi:glycoside hydrolase family 2 protein [Aquabacterium sp.]|uniref:glycoside hydrolase family 2 protein n=1 Tax=Aquabacterium sp. TaxID=1872578 RepID=UPI002C7B3025|nr:glycoside hydrolase family 2 TIM barrel-domain containing protein [Aquabacterium sp.]HSW08163.1 glycoside hydrolase family 2 TIM barrel-domain containing protein [Aquabacterium sp.]
MRGAASAERGGRCGWPLNPLGCLKKLLALLLLAASAAATACVGGAAVLPAFASRPDPQKVGQRQIVPLDERWCFQRADVAAASQPDFDDTGWDAVQLPHTWNASDGEAGGDYYRGPGWYRRHLDLPSSAMSRRHVLQFDGAALVAEVWVNGQLAGRHEGGYAAFRLDVTPWLQPGRNVIAVRVDNATQAHVAPLGGDFTIFGGLYRGVKLISVAPAHIDLLDDGGPGVYVSATDVSRQRARLTVQTRVRNAGASARTLQLRVSLRDARGRLVQRLQPTLQADTGSTMTVEQQFSVSRPRLWQGVRDPHLYTLTAELRDGTAVLDSTTVPVGIRRFAIDPQRGLLLNGRPYAVHGVNLFHSGRPGQGLAVTDAQVDEDFQILQDLGVTGVRLVHFQHPQRAYDNADRHGHVVWTEIPLNAAMAESDGFRANLDQQLRELVKQNFNHPSVFIWGLGNEVYRSDPPVRDLLALLHNRAKALDPSRLTSYAHCCAADDHPMAQQTDVIGFNRYFGWYDKDFAELGRWADQLHARLPERAISLSEYGAGASVLQQEDPPRRPLPNSAWHPEQYQALFHEAYWRQIRERPYLWGNFVWVGFDLASAGRNEGDRAGINDKGLITYDRQVRKDAYFWYQANWSRRPMAYISSRRFTQRTQPQTDVKVYTNGRRATLFVNGVAQPTQAPTDHVLIWPAVPLRSGPNRLRVVTEHGASDEVVWTHSPAPDSPTARPPEETTGPGTSPRKA